MERHLGVVSWAGVQFQPWDKAHPQPWTSGCFLHFCSWTPYGLLRLVPWSTPNLTLCTDSDTINYDTEYDFHWH